MKLTTTKTDNIPLLICGGDSDKAFLFVHGIGGNKEEAIRFAEIAGKHGWQTYAVDLPGHNGRTDPAKLVPWEVIPELRKVMDYIKSRAKSVSVRATSIGAYFSLLAFQGERIDRCRGETEQSKRPADTSRSCFFTLSQTREPHRA